ncbi:MAG: hypothetical protein M0T83_08680 [Nitrospiraceae bacterium]|nr:hypothetical protein [Nitrospiraceae bacterium]
MPSIPRSDRRRLLWTFLLGGFFSGLLSVEPMALAAPTRPPEGDSPGPVTQYSSLALPVSNFGFRGVARDRAGALYVASALKNGIYILPPSCRNEDCATLIPLEPSLGDPGDVVVDPERGGAYVLLRLGDRVTYVPPRCLAKSCLRTFRLPERPAYPFRAVYDSGRHRLAVLDRLGKRVVFLSGDCASRHCLSFFRLPSSGSPSGIAYDPKRGDLWVTFVHPGAILRIPEGCRKISCSVALPGSLYDLAPAAPGISPREDRLYLSLKKGAALGWIDLGKASPPLRIRDLEPTSGRISRLLALSSGGIFLVTGGTHPHAGYFRSSPSCQEGCFDLRLFPLPNGTPASLSPGGRQGLWMTVDDRDALFRMSLSCNRKGATLSRQCVSKIPFEKIETLYHSRYHQEIQVPKEPSPDLSRPSD